MNIRNSKLSKTSIDHLAKQLVNHETMLTALSFKYCFISFEHLFPISNALRMTKNLVKLDLSNNGLKSRPAAFVLDALIMNMSLTEINFHGNLLDNEFAVDLAHLLEKNVLLYKVDIS